MKRFTIFFDSGTVKLFFFNYHRYIMINQKQYGSIIYINGHAYLYNFIFIDSACIYIYIYMFECIHDIHVPIKFG